jgi:hypothetical protein
MGTTTLLRGVLTLMMLVALIDTGVAIRRVMPWMCLERCGSDTVQIQSHLAQLKAHRSSITAVSFEKYNLGKRVHHSFVHPFTPSLLPSWPFRVSFTSSSLADSFARAVQT